MMNSIYICAGSLCACLVVCSIVRIVCPSGNTQKIMSLVISIFTVCCLISPFCDIADSFDFSDSALYESEISEKVQTQVDTEVISLTADYISQYVYELLSSENIDNTQVATVMGTDEDGGIYIKELRIYLSGDYFNQKDKIKEMIQTAIGVTPKFMEC